jgi:D-beta-D-heptose 7-phosphate kinase / D-beta-D-heptose 1-phosphate adenosyltransferase
MTVRPALLDALTQLDGTQILCVGDVMLDRFVYGAVERVSPEAPIPVLHVRDTREMLGGAGNVVRNLAALGIRSTLAGVVHDDAAGQAVRRLVAAEETIDAVLLDDPARRTTVKTRFVSGGQQLLRMDEEDGGATAESVQKLLSAAIDTALTACGAVLLSDYGKGVLSATQATDVLPRIIAAANAAGKPVVIDPKGSDYTRYRGAGLLTPNRNELREATRMPVDGNDAIVAAARHLIDSCGVGAVLVTRGPDGMTLVAGAAEPVHLPALAREVFDVSGAGDTVVAVIAAGLAAGLDTAIAAELANVAAGIVVGKAGTAVVHRDELAQALSGSSEGRGNILSRAALVDRVAVWRQRGLTVGFTNGCFDLIHPGHISLLDQAAAACDRLIVAINTDASVVRLKGPNRPVQNEAARSIVLASLASVDAVVTFDEDTPLALIEAVVPDVLVKGADYARAEVVGGDIVEAHGGRVVLARLEQGFSTTATIARIAQ